MARVSALTVDEHGTAYFVGRHGSERTTFGAVWGEAMGQYSMDISDAHEARAYTLTPAGALSSVVLTSSAVSWVANDSAGTPPPPFATLGQASYVPWPGGGAVLTWTQVDGYAYEAGETTHNVVVGGATITGTPPPLPASDAVLYADDGHLWVGTSAGATKLDGATGGVLAFVSDYVPTSALLGGKTMTVATVADESIVEQRAADGTLLAANHVAGELIAVEPSYLFGPIRQLDGTLIGLRAAVGVEANLANSAKATTNHSLPWLQNFHADPVVYKFEDCDALGLAPGSSGPGEAFKLYTPIDGVKPPRFTRAGFSILDWYKLNDGGRANIESTGWVTPYGGFQLPEANRVWADVIGGVARPSLYARRPGRKAEPEWSLATGVCGESGLPVGVCGVGITDWLEDVTRFRDSCATTAQDTYKRLRGVKK